MSVTIIKDLGKAVREKEQQKQADQPAAPAHSTTNADQSEAADTVVPPKPPENNE
jgi:hypothetical protein